MSKHVVARYVSDFDNGQWPVTSATLAFLKDGTLADGQHRLAAQVETGDTVTYLVVTGLRTMASTFIDKGRRRTSGDEFYMDGVKQPVAVAAGIRLLLSIETGSAFWSVGQKVTDASVFAWLQSNLGLVTRVGRDVPWTAATKLATPSTLVCAALRMSRIDHGHACDFFERLARGGELIGSPINTLREKLITIERSGIRRDGVYARDIQALFVLAWNAWVESREVRRFVVPAGGWTKYNFPLLARL